MTPVKLALGAVAALAALLLAFQLVTKAPTLEPGRESLHTAAPARSKSRETLPEVLHQTSADTSSAQKDDLGIASRTTTVEEKVAHIYDRLEMDKAARLERDTEKLLAAGFSLDRIAWIRQRTSELLTKLEIEVIEYRKEGRQHEAHDALSYMIDPDIGLRVDLGDEEYGRYRQALGRTLGVSVDGVAANSKAEAAGLKQGDEVVTYGGRRVFNAGELGRAIAAGTPGEMQFIEVRRNGQTIQLSTPPGELGIRHEYLVGPTRVDANL